ncbi:DUF4249 family protein [Spirosoma sp. HMF4905]|uniref:DUF4249 family protein n=1 Tax=Spirosoma arboris TaxID=2682092 RepID=A0A7K1SD68_9BACT|nr:DUF4249 domain-containing protein [Spirosoma arboris]MVM31762.1 DUF4249 family protein [Spirosoma arboris]
MRSFVLLGFSCLTALLLPLACVDPLDQSQRDAVNAIVVDGTITDLAEPMIIQLNRAQGDRLTGRSGTLPITKATVEVVVDSSEVIACHETIDGNYQLPSDFKGRPGHAYQLRFTLNDGTHYLSTQQVMPVAPPPIDRLTVQFNPTSISQAEAIDMHYRAGHDVYLDTQDPVDVHNYYRWDWTLYERQDWCRSCYQGLYVVNKVVDLHNGTYQSTDQPLEDCFYPLTGLPYQYVQATQFDYFCRTQCWEILHSHIINIFDDELSNGGLIARRPVAHIPFYQRSPCLVVIRQGAITKDAHHYFNSFELQTQNTGGLSDTPPTVLPGNVHNVRALNEVVVGYFTASSVVAKPYYIDRKDAEGIPPTLFYALNARVPHPEDLPPPSPGPTFIIGGPSRPPTAVCGPIDQRTPFKPVGWPN